MTGYKWKAGDWVTWGPGNVAVRLSASHIQCENIVDACERIDAHRWRRVIVRPKLLPRKIKRSELRAWFERQPAPFMFARNGGRPYRVTTGDTMNSFEGATEEKAILALRKYLRKAGKFTP